MSSEEDANDAGLESLRRRLAAVDPADDPAEAARELEAIERALREAAGAGCDAAGLAADLRHWRRLCDRFGLDEASSRAGAELDRLTASDLADFAERAETIGDADPPDSGEALAALERGLTLSFELRATGGESDETDDRRARLERARARLRAAVERAELATRDAGAKRDAATRWIDKAETVLAEADDCDPPEAARRLEEVADELEWLAGRFGGGEGRRLRKKARRLRAEQQERGLQGRLEKVFGPRLVALSEQTVLGLTFVVLALLVVEATVSLSPAARAWFLAIDTAACLLFLTEYFTKVALAESRARWALRHAFVDLVPSIPFGLILGAGGNAVRVGRLGRLLRLPRLLRYLRLLRPVMRGFRGVALLARGLDRLVRRYGRLLNHNVILYPTEDELARAGEGGGVLEPARQLQLEARGRWQTVLAAASGDRRGEIATKRLAPLVAARAHCRRSGIATGEAEPAAREIPAGVLLRRLERVTPEAVEAVLGPELVDQAARAVRLLGTPPVRFLPGIARCVGRVRADEDDGPLLARVARRLARMLKRVHDAWFWAADLYGTVTPSQFVDRVGGMLVKGSFRPAYRLAMAAGGLLLVELLLQIARIPQLEQVRAWLFELAGIPVMVLGSVCMLLLGIGWWLQRVAQEATEFYERSAKAQFLSLTETIRDRRAERDGRLLYERVLRPHHRAAEAAEDRDGFVEAVRGRAGASSTPQGQADERLVLLYRDWADGAPLTDSDTRATSQFLGDPSLAQLLDRAGRIDAKERKGLGNLDLERQKGLLGGPYLWFNLITRSIAHAVACLIVEYNRHAIPLDDLDRAADAERSAYQQWLESGCSSAAAEGEASSGEGGGYRTTAFTALHFLDADPARDAAVERRFGPAVRKRMEGDRRLMIRRIYGTWPLHEQPKALRTLNLYALYEQFLGGGRALLLPVWALGGLLRLLRRGLRWLWHAVKELYRPEQRSSRRDAARADFTTAARKINRVRGPLVEATIRLRAQLDPAYLGYAAPGAAAPSGDCAAVDDDLAFYGAEAELRETVAAARRRTASDMRRLQSLIDDGLLARAAARAGVAPDAFDTPAHRRAAARVYCADLAQVRSLLSGPTVLRAVAQRDPGRPGLGAYASPRVRTRLRFRRFVRAHGIADASARGALWRAVRRNTDGAGEALAAWSEWGEDGRAEAERRLGRELLQGTRIGEEVLTLRAIQTLALLDVLHDREHIHRLGEYGDADQRAAWARWSAATAG